MTIRDRLTNVGTDEALFAFMGFGITFMVGGAVKDSLIDPIVDGLSGMIDGIFGSTTAVIVQFVMGVGNAFVDFFAEDIWEIPGALVGGITDTIGGVLDIPARVLEQLASPFGLTGHHVFQNTVTGPGGQEWLPISWAVAGVIVIAIGLGLWKLPSFLGTIGGGAFMLVGAMLGFYGFFPDRSSMFLGGGFALIVVGGMVVAAFFLRRNIRRGEDWNEETGPGLLDRLTGK